MGRTSADGSRPGAGAASDAAAGAIERQLPPAGAPAARGWCAGPPAGRRWEPSRRQGGADAAAWQWRPRLHRGAGGAHERLLLACCLGMPAGARWGRAGAGAGWVEASERPLTRPDQLLLVLSGWRGEGRKRAERASRSWRKARRAAALRCAGRLPSFNPAAAPGACSPPPPTPAPPGHRLSQQKRADEATQRTTPQEHLAQRPCAPRPVPNGLPCPTEAPWGPMPQGRCSKGSRPAAPGRAARASELLAAALLLALAGWPAVAAAAPAAAGGAGWSGGGRRQLRASSGRPLRQLTADPPCVCPAPDAAKVRLGPPPSSGAVGSRAVATTLLPTSRHRRCCRHNSLIPVIPTSAPAQCLRQIRLTFPQAACANVSQSDKDEIVRATIQFCQVRRIGKWRGHPATVAAPIPHRAERAALNDKSKSTPAAHLLQRDGFIPVNCCPAMPTNDSQKWQQWAACLWWVGPPARQCLRAA